MRQGDPLSPFLFCIMKDVLRCDLLIVVQQVKIKLLWVSREMALPTHVLYMDDIILFNKSNKRDIN